MNDSVYLFIGGTSGVDLSLVEGIANQGGRVLFVARNSERSFRVEQALRETTGNRSIEFIEGDMGDSRDV